jgi:hypothetical protein
MWPTVVPFFFLLLRPSFSSSFPSVSSLNSSPLCMSNIENCTIAGQCKLYNVSLNLSGTGWQAVRSFPLSRLSPSERAYYTAKTTFAGNASSCPTPLDVGDAEIVLDLSCGYKWSGAFFHNLFDCFLPADLLLSDLVEGDAAAALRGRPLALVSAPQLRPVLEDLLLRQHDWLRAAPRILHPAPAESPACLRGGRPGAALLTPALFGQEATLRCPESVRARMLRYAELFTQEEKGRGGGDGEGGDGEESEGDGTAAAAAAAAAAERGTIVLLQREARYGRHMLNFDALLRAVRAAFAPALSVVPLYGTEGLGESIAAVARARAVVAYHGAGMVYCLFCPRGALLLEITTYLDYDRAQVWRTNARVTDFDSNVALQQLRIDLEQVVPKKTARAFFSARESAGGEDFDHFLKRRNFFLSEENIAEIVRVLAEHVAAAQTLRK